MIPTPFTPTLKGENPIRYLFIVYRLLFTFYYLQEAGSVDVHNTLYLVLFSLLFSFFFPFITIELELYFEQEIPPDHITFYIAYYIVLNIPGGKNIFIE